MESYTWQELADISQDHEKAQDMYRDYGIAATLAIKLACLIIPDADRGEVSCSFLQPFGGKCDKCPALHLNCYIPSFIEQPYGRMPNYKALRSAYVVAYNSLYGRHLE